MRLWLSRTSDVPLREQLVTQVILGILTQDLTPGQRMPSTRELARRFGIHANTASAAYRELEAAGWLELRHGSGVYVQVTRPASPLPAELAVDHLIREMAKDARKLGVTEPLLRERLRLWLTHEPPTRWLVIEPDPDLRAIVIHEMVQAVALPVTGCAPEDCATAGIFDAAMPVVLPSKAAAVRKLLPPGTELTVLQVHSVAPELQAHLQRYLPLPPGVLVGIASHWREFQRIAQTMLTAAGLEPESLIVRDATRAGWKRGLEAAKGVVCDAITAAELPPGVFPLRYKLLDEPTLTELRKQEQQTAPA
jgi:GntR family transcriptional regulator